jgi:GxxExxY protein
LEAQKPLTIMYKEHRLKKEYTPDLLCYDQIIVDLKAIERLSSKDEAQVLNYLKATQLRVRLLINFGSYGKLEWKRLVK